MLGGDPLVAFVPSLDLDRAREFYVDVLGLTLMENDGWAVVADAAGTTVRITKVDALTPHAFTSLGWLVPDIGAEVMELTDRGVSFERFDGMDQDALGIWQTPGGDRVCWFKDPDGNLLSLTQPAEPGVDA